MYICRCILVLALPYSKYMYVLRCTVHVFHRQGDLGEISTQTTSIISSCTKQLCSADVTM